MGQQYHEAITFRNPPQLWFNKGTYIAGHELKFRLTVRRSFVFVKSKNTVERHLYPPIFKAGNREFSRFTNIKQCDPLHDTQKDVKGYICGLLNLLSIHQKRISINSSTYDYSATHAQLISPPQTISTTSNSRSPITPQLQPILSIYQTFTPFSFPINNHPPLLLQKCRCIIYSSSH